MRLYGVILAGGGGTRLWPLSRQHRPKSLIALLDAATMLQSTVNRLDPLITPERLFVAVNAVHAPEVARQLPEIPAARIVVEPVGRDTGPALGLAAMHLAHYDPEATLASFHADHVVLDPAALRRAVAIAAEAAQSGAIATIGIAPRHAATGYGYIELRDTEYTDGDLTVRRAARFVEKPDRDTAEAYLASGNYVWNAGLFICKVGVLLDAFATHLPDVYAGLRRIGDAIGTPAYDETLETIFPALPKVSFDVGVMERFHPVVTVPCDPGWHDVGDWHTLATLTGGDAHGNASVGAPHIAINTRDTLVHGRGRLVATIGVDNIVVVDTEDAVLVLSRRDAQDVKRLVEQIAKHPGAALT